MLDRGWRRSEHYIQQSAFQIPLMRFVRKFKHIFSKVDFQWLNYYTEDDVTQGLFLHI